MLSDLNVKRGGKREAGAENRSYAGLPLVSVVTAVFNGSDCIANCIESVLQQDYPNIEHIIIDGGSTDGTLEVLRRYADRLALWISEPDHGVYDAWNKGLELAQGEWLAFLGADDIYMPDAVSTYMDLALQCPQAEFLSSRALLNHPTGYAPVFGGPWQWPRFSKRMTTIHVGTMHRRTLFEQYGKFDTTYRIAADYQFLLRARDRLRTGYTAKTTVIMRAGGISDSTAGLYETRRAKVNVGVRSTLRADVELMIAIARFYLRRGFLKVRALFV